ncbi:LysR family transcriptional regulator [Rudanella paleaurantiibacter]|uniref:LysR family transcriptional regulator n=1 Tax=Rudanella paleaurantiibacter TaxID=2614655 RepID=A0A7J5U0A0_9BACT|nr:LysR substrate-binding domain-containing protein [Rudanella paleaurantiibacter]KAB7731178.1 LysR family transcriptional regulator [Rudanella paleaurantiibacter]
MSLDTVTLQCFLAVAETGSFTKAADRVNRTQSAVSQQLAKLELILGKTLINRGKILSLTNEGEIFLGYARQIFALHREALDRFKQPELEGEVRFGLPEDLATVLLSDVLVNFSRIHPRVFLKVECDLTLNLFDRFRRGEFDLILVKMSRPEEFPEGVDMWSESLEWVGKDEHFKNSDAQSPLPLVLSPQPCVYRARAIEALETAGIPWRLVYSSPSYTGTVAAVKAGLGLTVLPKAIVPAPLEVLRSNLLPPLPQTHVSLLRQGHASKAVESLEEFVLKKVRH